MYPNDTKMRPTVRFSVSCFLLLSVSDTDCLGHGVLLVCSACLPRNLARLSYRLPGITFGVDLNPTLQWTPSGSVANDLNHRPRTEFDPVFCTDVKSL